MNVKYILTIALLLQWTFAWAAGPSLPRFAGVYVQPAKFCSANSEGGAPQSCKSTFNDCLTLRPINAKQVYVEVQSFQNDGNTCEIKGVANFHDGHLVYLEQGEGGMAGFSVELILTHKEISIKYLDPKDGISRSTGCGSSARLDLLHFKTKNKSNKSAACFGNKIF